MLFKKQKTFEWFSIGVITLLAFILRLWGVTNKEFWYDEAYTGIMVKLPSEQLQKLLLFDVHPPVYIYSLRLWTLLVGESDFSIRLFSVLAGVLVVLTSYLLVKSLAFSKKYPFSKVVVPLIVAVNPFFVEYSKEARSYSLVALIFSLLFLSYYFASKSLRFNIKWLLTGVILLIAFLTHYLVLIGIAGLFIFDIFFTRQKEISLKNFIIKKTQIYLSLAFLILPAFFYYLPTILTQYKNAPQLWWIPIADLQHLSTTMYIFLFGVKTNTLGVPQPLKLPPYPSYQNIGFVLLIAFAMTITYALAKFKKTLFKNELILLLACSVFPIALVMGLQFFGNRLFLERYLTPFAIIFVILCGLLIFLFKKIIKYILVTLYVFISLTLIYNVSQEKTGYEQLAQKLKKIENQHVQVILPDPISFTIAKYYLINNKNIQLRIYDPKENLTDWEIIADDEVLKNYSQLKEKQRIWVYNTSEVPDIWYRETAHIDNLYIYSSVMIFNDLADAKTRNM